MHIVLDHPLVRHRITVLRDRQTTPKVFRGTISEIATFLAYEALRDLPTTRCRITTPVAQTQGDVISCRTVVGPVLRAGLGMMDAVTDILPDAVVGLLGLQRDESTGKASFYYSKVPVGSGEDLAILVDPMLATGGTACDAVRQLKALGYRTIKVLSVIAAKTGLDRFEREHPDVPVYLAALDEKLNEYLYISPGLGDAGDRIFNTVTNSALSKYMKGLEARILADGRVDMSEAGELLRRVRPMVGADEDFATFKSELENVRADGIIDPIESDRIAKMIAALADKADAGSVFICPDCGRSVSVRTFENGVTLCPWCGRTCSGTP